jgi:predicted DNA-binding transcriptional regulator YafY
VEDDRSSHEQRRYLTLAQIAKKLGVSKRTAVRYRSEYAAYLNPFTLPGGKRGLREEALEVLKVIHELKTRRAHWSEIKQELDGRYGGLETAGTGSKSFLRSLEAINQSHLLVTAELRLLFGDVNLRLDALEATIRQIQSLLPPLPHPTARPPDDAPRTGSLFSDDNGPSPQRPRRKKT